MFSPALEIVLTVAYREATVAASHAPDARAPALRARARPRTASGSSPPAAPTCRSCARDLDKYLTSPSSSSGRGQQKEPEQTMAFRRVLQTAVLHVQSAGRQEVQSGDVLAATLQQTKSYAAQLLAAQGDLAPRRPRITSPTASARCRRPASRRRRRRRRRATRRPAQGERGTRDRRAIRSPPTR